MELTVFLLLLAGIALLAALVGWNNWHPGRRREVDLYDGLDDPDAVAGWNKRASSGP